MRTLALQRAAKIVTILALLPVLASAQSRRMAPDPIDPTLEPGGGDPRTWNAVAITNLAPGASLGTLWAESAGTVYVWSTQTLLTESYAGTTPRRTPGDELPPGDQGAPTNTITNSALLVVTGGLSQAVLDTPGEVAATVYGTDGKDIYAATDIPNGGVRLYHFNGQAWRAERLPPNVMGPAGSIVGEPGRMFFRAGNMILEGHGRSWSVAYTNDLLARGTELVYQDQKHVLAPGDLGQAILVDHEWLWQNAGEAMHMDGAWGTRDKQGNLHLFATGSDPHHCGMDIWQYDESTKGTFAGCYNCVVQDPGMPHPGTGTGIDVYGLGVHDVYATGKCHGVGQLMYFNGDAWFKASPIPNMPAPTGISGVPSGDMWIALSDRRLMHGALRDAPEVEPVVEIEPVTDGAGMLPLLTVVPMGARSFAVDFNLAQASDVSLAVYTASGRHVATIDRSRRAAGAHRVYWNAQGVSPGVYFCRVLAGSGSGSARVFLGR